jgi:hypothetical protein
MTNALASLLPAVIAWAEQREIEIINSGWPLSELELSLAKQVGVAYPERIRYIYVPQLPTPNDSALREFARDNGLLGPEMKGLTLMYGIYFCQGHHSKRLLLHECRHVHQYEQAGSIASYLPKYLREVIQFGYVNAPYEIDARAHEVQF